MAKTAPELPPDIISIIADHLLADDPVDLISFRAVCSLFRSSSPNPRSLASIYRPRQWIMLSDGGANGDLTIPRSFLNLSSSRSLQISLSDLYGYSVLSSVDGLLILLQKATLLVLIFNPFTRLLVDLPPLPRIFTFGSSSSTLASVAISSSEDPTIVISFDNSHVLFFKPGNEHWVVFNYRLNFQCRCNVLFFQSHFYSINHKGAVCSINLDQIQQQEEVGDKIIELVSPDWEWEPDRNIVYRSYLVESNSSFLLVRKYYSSRPNGAHVEVYRVNAENNTFSLVNSIGDHALFVGPTRTLSVSSKDFAFIKGNAIYFRFDVFVGPVVTYSLENHICEPISVKTVRPFTLVDHLITYCSQNSMG